MAVSPDPHVTLAMRSEAAARAWAVLVLVVVSVTTPVLYFQRTVDGGTRLEEPTSLWSGIGELLLAPDDDFLRSETPGASSLVVGRVGIALLVVGLFLAAVVASRWLAAGSLESSTGLAVLRVAAEVLLVGGVLALAYSAGETGRPTDTGVSKGIDVAAGLWAPLAVVVALLVRPVSEGWPWAGKH